MTADCTALLKQIGARDLDDASRRFGDLQYALTAVMGLRMARTRDQWDSSIATLWIGLRRCAWLAGTNITNEPWPGEPGLAELTAVLEAAKDCRAAETPAEFGGALATLWAAVDRAERGGRTSGELIPFPSAEPDRGP